jgi:replicative DNA helicase Mcm
LQAFGIDPDTGKIDIDRITSGVSASQRNKINQVKDIINDLEERFGKEIPVDEILLMHRLLGLNKNRLKIFR